MRTPKLLICLTFVALASAAAATARPGSHGLDDAPTGFDLQTNGFVDQATFDADLAGFVAVEGVTDGVGPVYNAASCGECHANPVAGGSSQVLEVRAGRMVDGAFVEHPGGSLIHSRAIDPSIQEHIDGAYDVRTFRASTSLLGLGYVEAIADETLLAIAARQPGESNGRVQGVALLVPVAEAPGATRVGRFGWKTQHASLLSFSGDAYLNEMGITTPLFPIENTSNGRSIDAFDPIADPDEADNDDLEIFTRFMRATKAPSRDAALAATPGAVSGEALFRSIGCAVCHVPSIETAPAGTVINGGTFVVPDALGSKTIRPYGDFLLHDVGTGDGIVEAGLPETRTRLRTAPLWGLRTRNRLMHDGASLTVEDAILRHAGEARRAAKLFRRFTRDERGQLLTFLRSL